MTELTINSLKNEAKNFSVIESDHDEASIFGSTDGKAVGTYLEHKFKKYLENNYTFIKGNSASGIDFPGDTINVYFMRHFLLQRLSDWLSALRYTILPSTEAG
ncbi:MAG: hypothetical protein LBN96_03855 [Desulfovibrio sp.]|jgi:hypothetical protein|nr:hypothetical protein [Desulfovibrio sp.]